VKPHEAGKAYMILAMVVALATSWSALPVRPSLLRVIGAYVDEEAEERT